MQISDQVEKKFRKELNSLLRKWGAQVDAIDVYSGYPENGQDIRIIVTVPALYNNEGSTERELAEIDLGKYIVSSESVMNPKT